MSFKYFIMTKYKFNIENTKSVGIYLKIMSHIEIWIKDIYELDNKKFY